MKDNLFKQNFAGEKGGVISYNHIRPGGLIDNVYEDNFSKYGKDYGSYAFELKLIDNDD